jgi:hypothetical protein
MISHTKEIRPSLAVLGFALCSMVFGQTADIQLRNWTVSLHRPGSSLREWIGSTPGDGNPGVIPLTHTVGDTPAVFVPFGPCRLSDSRVSAGGPGPIPAGTERDFDFVPAGCPAIPGFQTAQDVPPTILAWSLNFTQLNGAGPGYIYAYPTGGIPPTVSLINYNGTAGEIRNNAAILPVNATTGAFRVGTSVSATDVIIDANGIFLATLEISTQLAITAAFSGGGAIRGENSNTGTGSSGVYGLESATTGAVFGVFGKSSSTSNNSAGVKGVDSAGELSTVVPAAKSGVRGDSSSGVGVFGFSRSTAVAGSLLDGSTPANVLAAGYLGYSVGTYGVYALGDIGATGMKFFVEPHPSDPSKVIRYVALEGPEAGTYFRGTARTAGGWATIEVPESFRIVTDEDGLTVQLTVVGGPGSIWVASQDLKSILVRASRDTVFHYHVYGVRRAFRSFEPIVTGREFVPTAASDRLPDALPEEARKRLLANGTYNEDGSVNLTTAERLGWTRIWERRPE